MGALSGWLINLIRSGIPPGGAKLAAVDPVCGMSLSPAKVAGSYEYHGRTYRFCSRHCLAAFRADPGRYADKGAGEDSSPAHKSHDAL